MLSLICAITFTQPVSVTLKVDGIDRTAIVYPAPRANSPVVFVFHGRTGKASGAARMYRVQEAWPEATVVYPQGLDSYSPRIKMNGPGWQLSPQQDNARDLKFVDALLKKLKADYASDAKRIFACGMSNGAAFTFVLLQSRPKSFAGFASVAGAGAPLVYFSREPKPYLMINGKEDKLVSFAAAERTMRKLVALNSASAAPKPWAKGAEIYEGSNPVVWQVHDGGHTWPAGATANIVRFFKSIGEK